MKAYHREHNVLVQLAQDPSGRKVSPVVPFLSLVVTLSFSFFFKSSTMLPKIKPIQSAANRGVSVAREEKGARGGRSGGRDGHPTTATTSQMNQEEVSMPSAEVEAMKAELEMLCKTNLKCSS